MREPKAGDRRYTVQILASGQPRAYADTILHVRVTFEWIPYSGNGSWQLSNVTEEYVRNALQGLSCGFTEFRYPQDCEDPKKPTMDEHFRTRLDWLKEIEPGIWEFHTTSAFTD